MAWPMAAWGAGERFGRVESFLTNHCIECHGVKAKKADLVLNVYHDEAALLKDRKVFQQAIQMVHEGEMPPAKRPRPSDSEVTAFLEGIGAIFDEADRTAKPDPGRVTIRRLNRVEYNNTIRDLVGVDFQPAEDFPSDDIGHGFDNIADVLSISPVLMERYLAAAESVVQRAIDVDPPKPPIRHTGGRYLEPAGKDVPQTRFRPLAKGNLFTKVTFSSDGQYVMRVRAYAPPIDEEAPRIALSMAGTELLNCDATGDDEKHAVTYEAKFSAQPGEHRFAVALLNPADGDTKDIKRTVFVESVVVEGPADTRPPSQRRLLATTPAESHPEQTREVLTRFVSHAYRRPPTTDEINRLVGLVEQCEARGERWEAGVQMAFQAILVSPKFLFRVELDDRPQTLEPHP